MSFVSRNVKSSDHRSPSEVHATKHADIGTLSQRISGSSKTAWRSSVKFSGGELEGKINNHFAEQKMENKKVEA